MSAENSSRVMWNRARAAGDSRAWAATSSRPWRNGCWSVRSTYPRRSPAAARASHLIRQPAGQKIDRLGPRLGGGGVQDGFRRGVRVEQEEQVGGRDLRPQDDPQVRRVQDAGDALGDEPVAVPLAGRDDLDGRAGGEEHVHVGPPQADLAGAVLGQAEGGGRP